MMMMATHTHESDTVNNIVDRITIVSFSLPDTPCLCYLCHGLHDFFFFFYMHDDLYLSPDGGYYVFRGVNDRNKGDSCSFVTARRFGGPCLSLFMRSPVYVWRHERHSVSYVYRI